MDQRPSSMYSSVFSSNRHLNRWHAVLQHWLTHGANFDEVTRWYLGWKSSVPQGILDHERMRAQFNAALNTMNSVLEVRGRDGKVKLEIFRMTFGGMHPALFLVISGPHALSAISHSLENS